MKKCLVVIVIILIFSAWSYANERLIFKDIEGYTNEAECYILQGLARGKKCLEIGAFMGKSTVAMAEVALSVVTIDTFKNGILPEDLDRQMDNFTTLEDFKRNIEGYSNITFHIGRSEDILKDINDKFDLVFIDGDHSYETVKSDISICWEKLNHGGILVLHDYYLVGDPIYVGEVRKAFRDIFDKEPDNLYGLLAWKEKK